MHYRADIDDIFKTLSLKKPTGSHNIITPIDGSTIGTVDYASVDDVALIINQAQESFDKWKNVPAPRRGELIRLFADKLRENKTLLGTLVTMESGKILQEGEEPSFSEDEIGRIINRNKK